MESNTNQIRFREYQTGEKCPVCGRILTFADVFGKPYRKMCLCEEEKAKKEKEADILKGRNLYRSQIEAESGLYGQWLEKSRVPYVCIPGQNEAYNAVLAFVERYKNNYMVAAKNENGREISLENRKGLLIIGSTGCGKTHLAAFAAQAIIDAVRIPEEDALQTGRLGIVQTRMNPVKFVNTVDLMSRVKASFSRNDLRSEDVLSPYEGTGVLILDDIGAEKSTEWTQEKFYEIVEFRNNYRKPMILTSNLKPVDLQDWIGARTYDRIRESCRLVVITAPGQRVTA